MAEVTHVVGLSGGKDSTALALRLREVHPERAYHFVITPTGDELPEMLQHWRHLGTLLETPLTIVSAGKSLNGEIRRLGGLPNHVVRWCTRVLKIEPYRQWLFCHTPAVSYVGLRADELERQGIYSPIVGVEFSYPLRQWGWGLHEVQDYLRKRNVTIPARTDCARCYGQRLGEWWDLWKLYPAIYEDAERQEAETGQTFRHATRDSWPAALADLRHEFETGRVPLRARVQPSLFEAETVCRVCRL